MQHQALKYAPSLVTDGRFTQGLSHWFGSYVTHGKDPGGAYRAECAARLAGNYSSGMPYGISQYIDFPEIHSFPATRTASLVQLYPLGSNLALLVTTADTQLEGLPLQAGVEGAPSPQNRFQHPFRWQDDEGVVNIQPTSALSVSQAEYDSYDGEYAAGAVLVQSAETVTEVVHHQLYVSPRNPIVPTDSSLGYGSTRVECVPDEDLTSGTLTFLGTDAGEIERLRDRLNEVGVTRFVAVLADERQVMLQTVGAQTTTASGQHKFSAQYAALDPGGLAPDRSSVFAEWALFPRTDVTCKYTMPLYGYKYTLAYSYRGRTPLRAELTFRSTVSGEDGMTLPGFGATTFRVPSTSRSSSLQARDNYFRNVEVLRAESRAKVVGRPLLNIPVVDVAAPQQQTRTVTRFAKYNSPTVGYVYCDRDEVDFEARPLRNMRWEEGNPTTGVPGKLWLGGIVQLDNLPANPTTGDSLGEVAFTGHLAGQNPVDGLVGTVQDFVATLLYGTPGTLTADLFLGNVGGNNSGEELYVNFTYSAPGETEATPIYVSNFLDPDGDLISPELYSIEAKDTLGIRGSHWNTDTVLQFPRITVGSIVSFSDAVEPLEFLNSNSYEVVSVYFPPDQGFISDLEIGLLDVSQADFARNTSVNVNVGTQVGLQASGPQQSTCFLTDVSMWSGDRTAELPTDDSGGVASRDLLERHTDPLGSIFPRGTVVLYAGGGACPAGFKPVQATAESAQPGVPDVELVSPVATDYNQETNTTKLAFPLGSLPPLRDPSGGVISLTSAATVAVPAPTLEFDNQGLRIPATDILGDSIYLSQVIKSFRNAVEVGMILRVQESSALDSAPLVSEDRGFMIVDDLAIDLPPVYVADSAKRSTRPPGGGGGYRTGQTNEDVSSANVTDPAYHWGRGFGKVTYVSSDQGIMVLDGQGPEGYNRPEDQALLETGSLSDPLKDALAPPANHSFRKNYHLLPKYPTRFTQTPQFAPIAPGIWGQRERFFYDTPESENPRTDFERSPAFDNRRSPAILMTCRGFDNEVQIETGAGGGSSRIGVPKGGNYGYLPNPAWDLMDLESLNADMLQRFPAQPIQTSTDLLAGGGYSAAQGRIPIWEGMVFFCRIYAKCPENSWNFEEGRPNVGAEIRGWWSSITQNSATEASGVGFLLGTLVVQTYQVESAPALGYESNVNLRPYGFPLGGTSNAYGNSPHPSRKGPTWPSSLNISGYSLLQLTPVSLYGTPNQPQEFGAVDYVDWRTNEVATGQGRSAGPIVAQSQYTYTRPLFNAGTQIGTELVTAWGSVGPGADTSTLTVLGDARGLEAGNHPIYVEPSGYLKYGLTGAQMDYGPGRHTHDIARNPNLLGPMNLAQPVDVEGRYRVALPSVHGHGSAGTSRPMMPVANLFTSCIKL